MNTAAARSWPSAIRANPSGAISRIADCPDDFPVVKELRAEGATDYVAIPLVFTDGTVHVATWSTRQPGGFTSAAACRPRSDHRPADARRGNSRIAADRDESAQHLRRPPGRRTHPHGQDPARLRRGNPRHHLALGHARLHGVRRAAAAAGNWSICSTSYFDCQVPPILEHGGEVLKFMGDGLLAIFPLAANGTTRTSVCRRALAASRKASASSMRSTTPMRAKAAHSASGSRCTSAVCCMATSAAATGSISPASGRRSISRRGWRRSRRNSGQIIVASAEFAAHAAAEQFTQRGECTVAGFSAPQAVFCLTAPHPMIELPRS